MSANAQTLSAPRLQVKSRSLVARLILALLSLLIRVGALAALFGALLCAQDNLPCRLEDAAAAGGRLWVLCENEKVLISEDLGKTWKASPLPSAARMRAIEFLDPQRGFVAGAAGTLLATQDGGVSWRPVENPARDDLTAIHFIGQLGWVSGYGGMILHSKDGGRSWVRQPTDTSQSLEDVFFVDDKHGWAVGWAGTILRTDNGGAQWKQVHTPAAMWSLNSVYFKDAQNGWIAGMFGQILRSRDGGLTWQSVPVESKSSFSAIVFDGAGHGWIASENGVLMSKDGGESWQPAGPDGLLFLQGLVVAGESLYAVGPFGVWTRKGAAGWQRLALPATS